jgi:serine/threonine protein kinase
LGDCLGKGAFGSVYRALNWGTGETVAIKQVKLADLPKGQSRAIMVSLDSELRAEVLLQVLI